MIEREREFASTAQVWAYDGYLESGMLPRLQDVYLAAWVAFISIVLVHHNLHGLIYFVTFLLLNSPIFPFAK